MFAQYYCYSYIHILTFWTLIFYIKPLSVGLWVDIGNMESNVQHNREDNYTMCIKCVRRWTRRCGRSVRDAYKGETRTCICG
jgi:hypothetical protein